MTHVQAAVAALPEAAEAAPTRAPTKPALADNEYEIVRASARLRMILSTGKDDENSEAAKHLYRTLYETRRQVAMAANTLTQRMWLADAQALASSRARNLVDKNGKPTIEWAKLGAQPGALNVYQVFRDAAPTLGSQVCATMQKKVADSWLKKRFNVLVRMSESVPFYRQDASFPLRAQAFRVTHVKDTNFYEVSFSIRPGRHPGGAEFRVKVEAHDEYQHQLLHSLASGIWKLGDMLIEQDRRRKSRWYIRFAYTKRVTRPTHVGKVAAINRGITTFLTSVTEDGQKWMYEGHGIGAMVKQFQRRRQKYQRERIASNRYGHGRGRALQPLAVLEDKGARWRATKNQTIARRLVEWLVANQITALRMEDFTGIRDQREDRIGRRLWEMIQEWPFFDLGSRIRSCCEEEGIAVEVVDAKDLSKRCCFCGHVDKENIHTEKRRMICGRCKKSEHLDINAAKNLVLFEEGTKATALDRKMDRLTTLTEGGIGGTGTGKKGKVKGAGMEATKAPRRKK